MSKRICMLVALAIGLVAGPATAQEYPIMEKIAAKVIQKYQTSSCDQLRQDKQQSQGKAASPMEERAIAALKSDPKMRQAFFNKVSAPIVTKMFECGMIP